MIKYANAQLLRNTNIRNGIQKRQLISRDINITEGIPFPSKGKKQHTYLFRVRKQTAYVHICRARAVQSATQVVLIFHCHWHLVTCYL